MLSQMSRTRHVTASPLVSRYHAAVRSERWWLRRNAGKSRRSCWPLLGERSHPPQQCEVSTFAMPGWIFLQLPNEGLYGLENFANFISAICFTSLHISSAPMLGPVQPCFRVIFGLKNLHSPLRLAAIKMVTLVLSFSRTTGSCGSFQSPCVLVNWAFRWKNLENQKKKALKRLKQLSFSLSFANLQPTSDLSASTICWALGRSGSSPPARSHPVNSDALENGVAPKV